MKHETNISFPCGYVYSCSFNTLFFIGNYKFDSNDLPICPIHGKDCKSVELELLNKKKK